MDATEDKEVEKDEGEEKKRKQDLTMDLDQINKRVQQMNNNRMMNNTICLIFE